MTRIKTSLSALAAVGALAATGLAAAPGANAATNPQRHRIPRTLPAWVGQGARTTGSVSAKGTSTFKVYLAPRKGLDQLKADVAAVSDPKSPSYRHFITAKQYHRRYDATAGTVRSVSRWLTSNELRVTKVEAHHRYLSVRGSNAAVERAFATRIAAFKRHGRSVQANITTLSVPQRYAGAVITVTGLDTSPHKVVHHSSALPAAKHAPPAAGFRNARPCSRYYGQLKASTQADFKTPLPKFQGKVLPYAVCGYTGVQFRAAYEGDTALTGDGVTVAITDAYASPTIVNDVTTYTNNHGDGEYAPGQYTESKPLRGYNRATDCDPSGWYGEQTLDIEAVHAMAPEANIRYYPSASCFDDDFLSTLGQVVDENKASLVSNSWGDLEQNESTENVAAYEQIFMQGALQGIGFMFSSGDNGDELQNSGIKQADYPTSDPYVTSVGGTADAIGAAGTHLFQTGWGTQTYSLSETGTSWTPGGYLYGAGGGESGLFNRPDYQTGVVPTKYGSGRQVPDVGLDADPQTGMLIGITQTFTDGVAYGEYRIGGTSLASPLFAGMTALTAQNAGGRLGFLNPVIYQNASSGVFDDVKGTPKDAGQVRVNYNNGEDASDGLSYLVRTFNQDSSLSIAKGWDDVTGIGAPNDGWVTAVEPQ